MPGLGGRRGGINAGRGRAASQSCKGPCGSSRALPPCPHVPVLPQVLLCSHMSDPDSASGAAGATPQGALRHLQGDEGAGEELFKRKTKGRTGLCSAPASGLRRDHRLPGWGYERKAVQQSPQLNATPLPLPPAMSTPVSLSGRKRPAAVRGWVTGPRLQMVLRNRVRNHLPSDGACGWSQPSCAPCPWEAGGTRWGQLSSASKARPAEWGGWRLGQGDRRVEEAREKMGYCVLHQSFYLPKREARSG